ncbi:MAG TPA: hypothetical protein VK427_18745 [Kofleriaceae bacterium]|nr:hypothetical protein [Kofleriaceae bacterium]
MTPEWHPPRYDLVRNHTQRHVNQGLDRRTKLLLDVIGSEPHAIRQRLWAIDREWHVDRALMAVFSVLGAFSAHRSFKAVRRRQRFSGWRVVFWAQMGFLLHHAIRGWSMPVAVLRRIGFRTEKEIAAERVVLEKRLSLSTGV